MATNTKKPIFTLLVLLAMLALHSNNSVSAAATAASTEVFVAHPEPMADLSLHRSASSLRRLVRRGGSSNSDPRSAINPALERMQSSTQFAQTDCRVRWTDACSNGTGSGGNEAFDNNGYNGGYSGDYGYNQNGYGNSMSGTNANSDERQRRPSEKGSGRSSASSSDHNEDRRKKRHVVGEPGRWRRRHLGRRMDNPATSAAINRRYVPTSGGIGSRYFKESAQGR